ncbi:Gfo/Idh/MocA family protein [Oceanobacillus bengalensis]|uniref:Gfo/Idh/MocA family oxidoreductase n=1 Tax=Oceanobacillus bengalensis TaxID=1435466 RepID=A0A494YTP4_9BACI|nr:Gfo/Idh/MocA family oxidoreductase [Oceanobacillus bengalensis]RKQ13470.1 gfo/Idh/MocA family oxidoreductase [Oceanobacillus bengalensis]
MEKIKWGILSTANIAQKELFPAFMRSTNAEVVAIASRNGNRARAVADKFQIETVYNSYDELLNDPAIQAVYIPLPNHLHKEWVIKAAEKGKHVLCEKPAGLDANEVKEMIAVCEENNVLFMEAFMYHFHPQHERVRQIIDVGEIGEVKYMRAAFSFYLRDKEDNIRMGHVKGGGSLYDVGCYCIHSIRNIFREEPEIVYADAVVDPHYTVDTDVYGQLLFASGKRATFDASFGLVNRNEYEVIGTKGKIVVPRAYRPDKKGGDGIVIVEKPEVTRKEIVNGDQYRNEIEHLSEAIQQGEKHLKLSHTNTINNMKVMDACFESMKTAEKYKM